jgi:hypothetical protein
VQLMCKRSDRQKPATRAQLGGNAHLLAPASREAACAGSRHLLEGGVQKGGMCKGGAVRGHLLEGGMQQVCIVVLHLSC